MQRESIHEEYSYDRLYRFIVCRKSDYVGENGRLYCLYEYKEDIDIFSTPEEIIAGQLSNHMPVSLKERIKKS